MRRTTPTDIPSDKAIGDNSTMHHFVRILVDVIVADGTIEQLFADEALDLCLWLIFAKNRGLHEFGGDPWPEEDLAQAARSHLDELRAARRH